MGGIFSGKRAMTKSHGGIAADDFTHKVEETFEKKATSRCRICIPPCLIVN
jgi:hypothetical protein